MNQNQIIDILREGIWVALKIGGPMLIASMAVGVLVAIFHAGNADSRTNAVFYSEAFVNHRVSPPCRQLDAEYDAGFYKDDIHPNDCLEGRGQRAR